jgi:hypothetical protein
VKCSTIEYAHLVDHLHYADDKYNHADVERAAEHEKGREHPGSKEKSDPPAQTTITTRSGIKEKINASRNTKHTNTNTHTD